MISYNFDPASIRGLESAIRRNPETVRLKTRQFITRGLAEYRKSIMRNPWRLGMRGGGAPTDTRALRDTHRSQISDFEGRIEPTAPYAPYVHEGTRKMEGRPYLEYARETQDPHIRQLEGNLLREIVDDLAK